MKFNYDFGNKAKNKSENERSRKKIHEKQTKNTRNILFCLYTFFCFDSLLAVIVFQKKYWILSPKLLQLFWLLFSLAVFSYFALFFVRAQINKRPTILIDGKMRVRRLEGNETRQSRNGREVKGKIKNKQYQLEEKINFYIFVCFFLYWVSINCFMNSLSLSCNWSAATVDHCFFVGVFVFSLPLSLPSFFMQYRFWHFLSVASVPRSSSRMTIWLFQERFHFVFRFSK